MRLLLLAPLGLALVACAGTSPPSLASPSPASSAPTTAPSASASAAAAPTTGPIGATAEFDGVVVTLRASEGRLDGGAPTQLRVEVLNAGLTPVTWTSGGCELLNGFGVETPAAAAPPAGRDCPGTAGLAKFSAMAQATGIDMVRPADLPDDQMFACPADLRYDEIDPGQTISADARWFGKGVGSSSILIDQYFPSLGHPHNDFLRVLYDYGAVGLGCFLVFLLGMVYVYLPFMLFPMTLGLSTVPRDLIDAGRDMGASRLQIWREIELPLAMPGILIGMLLTFVLAVGAVAEAKILGGQSIIVITHDIEIAFTYAQNWPLGSALSVLLMLVVGALVLIVLRRFDLDTILGRR